MYEVLARRKLRVGCHVWMPGRMDPSVALISRGPPALAVQGSTLNYCNRLAAAVRGRLTGTGSRREAVLQAARLVRTKLPFNRDNPAREYADAAVGPARTAAA